MSDYCLEDVLKLTADRVVRTVFRGVILAVLVAVFAVATGVAGFAVAGAGLVGGGYVGCSVLADMVCGVVPEFESSVFDV